MILLKHLNPRWLGQLRKPDGGEGLAFDCPKCGPSHTLVAYFSNPIDGQPPMPMPPEKCWKRTGDELDTVTIEPSIQYPCWHGFVCFGVVVWAEECAAVKAILPDGTTQDARLSPLQMLRAIAEGQRRFPSKPT